MVNKRGQGLSINALILIVLGIFILVTLIAGFTLGWSQLKSYLGFSGNNADAIISQCKTACELEQINAYCFQNRIVKIDGAAEPLKGSCAYFASPANPYKNQMGVSCSLSCGTCQDLGGQKTDATECSPKDSQIFGAGNLGAGQVCCRVAVE